MTIISAGQAVVDVLQAEAATYEPTEPTIDSQIVKLKSTGADALVIAATPKSLRRRSARLTRSIGVR
jgi:hypothetical protein